LNRPGKDFIEDMKAKGVRLVSSAEAFAA